MTILIFGASGATGHELVNQSLQQGHAVTAFVRNTAKLKVTNQKLKVIQGDITDKAVVTSAIKGHDVVLSALGASSPFKFDPVVVDGFGKIIKAMEELNIHRLVYLSFIGVRESRASGGFVIRHIASKLLNTEIAGHEAREKMIRESKLNWTIVRAPTLTNGKKRGIYRTGVDLHSDSFFVGISRSDVADFMIKQCADSNFHRQAARIMY